MIQQIGTGNHPFLDPGAVVEWFYMHTKIVPGKALRLAKELQELKSVRALDRDETDQQMELVRLARNFQPVSALIDVDVIEPDETLMEWFTLYAYLDKDAWPTYYKIVGRQESARRESFIAGN